MSDQTNAIAETALQTAEALLPALAATNPNTAAIAALAPIALQFLQSATQLQQAGAMTPEQLAVLFKSVGDGVQSTHSKWVALNAAKP